MDNYKSKLLKLKRQYESFRRDYERLKKSPPTSSKVLMEHYDRLLLSHQTRIFELKTKVDYMENEL